MGDKNLTEYDALYALPARWWLAKKTRREWTELLVRLRAKRTRIEHLGLEIELPLYTNLGKYLVVPNEFYMSKCIHAFLTLKPGAALDVGVHAGEFLVRFKAACARLGLYDAGYYGFEPNPASYAFVSELIKLNAWHDAQVFPVALAAESGLRTFYAARDADPCGSLHAEFNAGAPGHTRKVFTHAGDELVEALGIARLSMIKIDAEGAEADILAGLSETIAEHRPFIHCEIINTPGADHPQHDFIARRADGIMALMQELGYQVYAIREDGGFYHHIVRFKTYLPTIEGPIARFAQKPGSCLNYFMAHRDDMPALLDLLDPQRSQSA